jgi:ATP-dependent Clp endopeptidase proteolytic subunit ClpP
MKRVNVYGAIIPNDYKWYFDYFEEDSTCPRDINKAIEDANGDELEIYINSPGGIIEAGSEIYTMLRAYKGNVKIYIVGEACSAASIIAMARHCEMSPTALMMVHCVSSGVQGNHSVMEKMAEVLKTADDALSNAYIAKTGKSKAEVLSMMEAETWLTAEKAKELGLIDGIMFKDNEPLRLTASNFKLPSEERMSRVKEMMKEQSIENDASAFLIQKSKLSLLRLKGARNE